MRPAHRPAHRGGPVPGSRPIPQDDLIPHCGSVLCEDTGPVATVARVIGPRPPVDGVPAHPSTPPGEPGIPWRLDEACLSRVDPDGRD